MAENGQKYFFKSGSGSGGGTTTPPTLQTFTATGSQTGWLFTVTAWVGTIAVGDTYTNNGNTYTVQGAQTNGSGQTLFMSGTGATTGGTLTKGVSAAGPATITFSTKIATATYTTPANVRWLRIRMAGGGGGGAGGGTSGTEGSGTAGSSSFFGANLLTCTGGAAGIVAANAPATGGTATINSPAYGLALAGNDGQVTAQNLANGAAFLEGRTGTPHPLFGGAGGGFYASASTGTAGKANTGAGGAGGGTSSSTASQRYGEAGASAAGIDAIIPNPTTTYVYAVAGTAGGGTAGTNGGIGGAGAAGVIYAEEHY